MVEMRVLVAFEDDYRGLRELVAFAFRATRPRDEVETIDPGALAESVARFDPHLVISSVPNVVDPGGRAAWVELSPDPERPSKVCVGGRHSEPLNPSLADLLSIAQESEKLIGDERRPRAC